MEINHNSNCNLTYPEDWNIDSLTGVASVNEESLSSSTPSDFEFKYIDISSVSKGVIDWDSVSTQIFISSPSRARRVVRPGDILFSTVRPALQAHAFASWHNENGYICSTGFSLIRSKSIDPRFLYHLIFSEEILSQVRKLEVGSNYPAVNESDIKKLCIPRPEKKQQVRIAEILDTADKAIQTSEKLIAKLKAMKTGLLHDLLTRGIDENGNLRDPIRYPQKFKDSLSGRVPSCWENDTLGSVVSRYGGVIQTGPFGSQLHAYEYTEEGIPVIMPQDIKDGCIVIDQIARITQGKAVSLSRHKVQLDDVVFARRGDLSQCANIGEDEIGWLCGTGCLLLRPPKKKIDGRWFSSSYRHDSIQRQILARAVGSTMVNLNTGLLASLDIALPPIEEQREIVNIIHACTVRIQSEVVYRDKLILIEKGLMDDLLTGRVRINKIS